MDLWFVFSGGIFFLGFIIWFVGNGQKNLDNPFLLEVDDWEYIEVGGVLTMVFAIIMTIVALIKLL